MSKDENDPKALLEMSDYDEDAKSLLAMSFFHTAAITRLVVELTEAGVISTAAAREISKIADNAATVVDPRHTQTMHKFAAKMRAALPVVATRGSQAGLEQEFVRTAMARLRGH